MNEFKLCPADILVNVNRGKDPWAVIRRWAVGEYSHVFMYFGRVGLFFNRRQRRIIRVPLLFESNGRGVVLQSLANRYGQEVVILRLVAERVRSRIPIVLEEAVKLASNPQSYYDYFCILRFVLPRIICEKLHLPIPLAWQRDSRQICSEACFEVFYRVGLNLLPSNIVPLPGDFIESLLLEQVWAGKLSEEIV